MSFIVEKGEKYENNMSELDIARIEYEDGYQLRELSDLDPEEAEKYNGVGLSDIIERDDKPSFCVLSFYDDVNELKTSSFITMWNKRKQYTIKSDHILFPLIQALADDKKSGYFKINYAELQKELKKVTSISIISEIRENKNNYEFEVPIVVDIVK